MSLATASTGLEPALERWLEPLLKRLPGLALFDAHAHIGVDRDGTSCAPEQLEGRLNAIGTDSRAAIFPLHVASADYSDDNDAVIQAAATSAGRLVPFCRLAPGKGAVTEGRRAIAAGARGIKLHPRAEDFTLAHPEVEAIVALAAEHRLPVLIHAGRGIEPLGADALRLASANPRATLILAHAGITDLAWIGAALEATPNVVFDTAWWNPADLLALFAVVPPGRVVFGSDIPFGDPPLNALLTLRCALQAGLEPSQIEAVMGGQLDRILSGREPADLGPAPAAPGEGPDILVQRAQTYMAAAWGALMAGGSAEEPLALARAALGVDPSHADKELCDSALEALNTPGIPPMGLGGLAIAATLLATPTV